MEIASAKKGSKHIEFGSETFNNWLLGLKEKIQGKEPYLILLIGSSKKKKGTILHKIKGQVDLKIQQADANELISAGESETRHRLDAFFENFSAKDTLLHLTNGANLCGAFTGYTLSKVRYATPQERYFLKKLTEENVSAIIDFEDVDSVDATLRRAASVVISFREPQSGIKKVLSGLKKIRVNGSQLGSKRPVYMERSAGNF